MFQRLKQALGGSGATQVPNFTPPYAEINEPTSVSNFHEVLMNHMHFNLVPDFERKVLRGQVLYEATYIHSEQVEKRASVEEPSTLFMTLDTRDLTIEKVLFIPTKKGSGLKGMHPGDRDPKDAIPLRFEMGLNHESFGTPLKISLPEVFVKPLRKEASKAPGVKAKHDFILKIVYETAPEGVCTAIQWLSPEQTKDQKLPFLFTQCQAIHCRSMIPCQDAPACKATYSATVVVPQGFTALMSAENVGHEVDESHDLSFFHFEQTVPMAPYLIALVAGHLACQDIGPRTKVWAEPSMVKECAYEFEETEKYLSTAEQICGPYVWGRYDLLVLPPSFPYGGMENPCLTFVTPTLLAGDRSLSNVVAHEIAHSWMGNLVTNATWEDFWLNEGFTVWVERRIIGKAFSKDLERLKAAVGWMQLEKAVATIGPEHPFTQLHIPMDGIDPDDSFSKIPYEKGFAFLSYLEETVGGPKFFEPFILAHVDQFQFNTVNVNEWKSFFIDFFRRTLSPTTLNEIEWDKWLYNPGMPPIPKPNFASKLLARVEQSADEWTSTGSSSATRGQVTLWSTDEKLLFLERILANLEVDKECRSTMKRAYGKIDNLHNFSASRNSEVRFLWNTLGVRLRREVVFPDVAAFLGEQGRMKFVRPLYKDLFVCCTSGRKLAYETFKANASSYHAIARRLIAKDLHVTEDGEPLNKSSTKSSHKKSSSKSKSSKSKSGKKTTG